MCGEIWRQVIMAKIEIDISKEIEKAIQEEVERKMSNGGLLRFIREITIKEFKKSGIKSQVKRHETQIMHLMKK